jgi:hypothetical protein
MENTPTPFDLNRAIQQWRESLAQSPAFRRESLDELETHLRDSIASLGQRGLAEDEAFIIATKRVGNSTALGAEFGKLNLHGIWLNRALWMLVGTQVFGCIYAWTSIISEETVALGIRPVTFLGHDSPALYFGLLCGIAHGLTFAAALASGWWLLSRKANGLSAWLRNKPNRSSQSIALVAACAVPLLMTFLLRFCTMFLFVPRFSAAAGANVHLIAGVNYGIMLASYVESAALIILTLLLARRQLIARTGP